MRKAQYVSPATTTIGVTFAPATGGTTQTASTPCSPLNCAITVNAPLGSDTFTYTLSDKNGAALSKGSVTQTIVAGTINVVNATLGGVPASVVLTSSPLVALAGSAASFTLAAGAKDADGNLITSPGPYSVPLTIVNPAPATFTLSAAAFVNAGDIVTVTAPNTASEQVAAFTVTAPGLSSANVTAATVSVTSQRPAIPGTTYAYAGSMSQTIATTFANPAPQPTGTPIANGSVTTNWTSAQQVAVSGTSTAGTYDFHVVDTETQSSPAVVSQTTSDALYQYPANYTGNLLETSVNSVVGTPGFAASNVTLLTTYGSPGRIVDVLPETGGQSWTNVPAMSQTQTQPSGQQTVRTVAANGTYVQLTTQPVLKTVPAPVPVPTATVFAFAENSDGSGSFTSAPPDGNIYAFNFMAPNAGSIAIQYLYNGKLQSGSTTIAPLWFTTPVTLYSETDSTTSNATIPCLDLPAAIGTTGTLTTVAWTALDTIFGTIETQTQKQYDVVGVGVVCSVLSDTLTSYYDYTDGNYSATRAYSGAPLFFGTAWKTATTTQTLGIVSSSLPLANSRRTASLGATVLVRPSTVAFDRALAKLRDDETRAAIGALMRGSAK